MTPERKNEIWAMLTPQEKAKYSKEYLSPIEDDYDNGYDVALQNIFGSHNLTAQAQEKPTFTQTCTDDSSICKSQKEDAYFAYRLDLAKEIAVAMITTDRIDIAKNSVAIANEIVKRLKETEE